MDRKGRRGKEMEMTKRKSDGGVERFRKLERESGRGREKKKIVSRERGGDRERESVCTYVCAPDNGDSSVKN